jgi:metal-dependent hydrolase (beta-lactamase superfamily II)
VSKEKIDLTVKALKELDVKLIAPFHCSGMITRQKLSQEIPDAYIGVGAATVIEL